MINEFPHSFRHAHSQIEREGVVSLNGTEYLGLVKSAGCGSDDFISVQPVHQQLVWERMGTGGSCDVNRVIEEVSKENPLFRMEGGCWTNDLNWIKGYENVLDPVNKLSGLFHERIDNRSADKNSFDYRSALLYLLLSQTSCFRYWGQGRWTEYAKEICRRGTEILESRF